MISIPNYTIEKEIGRGGMATVYLAIQNKLKRKVAIKVMLPEMVKDGNFRKSFMSEATIIASLDHPNIVRIYDVEFVGDSILYMAMEYLSGNTLKERLLRGKMSFSESLDVITQISHGLTHAHEMGYIHRDIKPGNILFRKDGTAVLTDFGIAKLQDTSGELTRMGYTMGTLQYMSPEQVITTDLDIRSDIYSLGLVFYEMLTGLKAFKAESTVQAIHQHTTLPPPKLHKDYHYLQAVLDEVLAKKPEDRFQTVKDFLTAINHASELDKTILYKVDHEKIHPKLHDRNNNNLSKTKKRLPIILFGCVVLVGGIVFAIIDNRNSKEKGSALTAKEPVKITTDQITLEQKLVQTPIDKSNAEAKIKTVGYVISNPLKLENRTREISYFHKPQINSSKMENELVALQKSRMELLSFSPESKNAQEALKKILSSYLSLAEGALKTMNIEKARLLVDKGLTVSPKDNALSEFKRTLNQTGTLNVSKKNTISKLASEAESHVKVGHYVLPKGDNALETYQNILLVDPQNKEALDNIKIFQEIFRKQIEVNIKKNTYLANSLVNQARALFPYNKKFIQLQQNIQSMSYN